MILEQLLTAINARISPISRLIFQNVPYIDKNSGTLKLVPGYFQTFLEQLESPALGRGNKKRRLKKIVASPGPTVISVGSIAPNLITGASTAMEKWSTTVAASNHPSTGRKTKNTKYEKWTRSWFSGVALIEEGSTLLSILAEDNRTCLINYLGVNDTNSLGILIRHTLLSRAVDNESHVKWKYRVPKPSAGIQMPIENLVKACAMLLRFLPVELTTSILHVLKDRGSPVPAAILLSIAGQQVDWSSESMIRGATILISVLPATLSTSLLSALKLRASPVAIMLARSAFDGELGDSSSQQVATWSLAGAAQFQPVVMFEPELEIMGETTDSKASQHSETGHSHLEETIYTRLEDIAQSAQVQYDHSYGDASQVHSAAVSASVSANCGNLAGKHVQNANEWTPHVGRPQLFRVAADTSVLHEEPASGSESALAFGGALLPAPACKKNESDKPIAGIYFEEFRIGSNGIGSDSFENAPLLVMADVRAYPVRLNSTDPRESLDDVDAIFAAATFGECKSVGGCKLWSRPETVPDKPDSGDISVAAERAAVGTDNLDTADTPKNWDSSSEYLQNVEDCSALHLVEPVQEEQALDDSNALVNSIGVQVNRLGNSFTAACQSAVDSDMGAVQHITDKEWLHKSWAHSDSNTGNYIFHSNISNCSDKNVKSQYQDFEPFETASSINSIGLTQQMQEEKSGCATHSLKLEDHINYEIMSNQELKNVFQLFCNDCFAFICKLDLSMKSPAQPPLKKSTFELKYESYIDLLYFLKILPKLVTRTIAQEYFHQCCGYRPHEHHDKGRLDATLMWPELKSCLNLIGNQCMDMKIVTGISVESLGMDLDFQESPALTLHKDDLVEKKLKPIKAFLQSFANKQCYLHICANSPIHFQRKCKCDSIDLDGFQGYLSDLKIIPTLILVSAVDELAMSILQEGQGYSAFSNNSKAISPKISFSNFVAAMYKVCIRANGGPDSVVQTALISQNRLDLYFHACTLHNAQSADRIKKKIRFQKNSQARSPFGKVVLKLDKWHETRLSPLANISPIIETKPSQVKHAAQTCWTQQHSSWKVTGRSIRSAGELPLSTPIFTSPISFLSPSSARRSGCINLAQSEKIPEHLRAWFYNASLSLPSLYCNAESCPSFIDFSKRIREDVNPDDSQEVLTDPRAAAVYPSKRKPEGGSPSPRTRAILRKNMSPAGHYIVDNGTGNTALHTTAAHPGFTFSQDLPGPNSDITNRTKEVMISSIQDEKIHHESHGSTPPIRNTLRIPNQSFAKIPSVYETAQAEYVKIKNAGRTAQKLLACRSNNMGLVPDRGIWYYSSQQFNVMNFAGAESQILRDIEASRYHVAETMIPSPKR